jgi:Uma2 family endonuclease
MSTIASALPIPVAAAGPPQGPPPGPPVHRLTVDEYDRIVAAGVLDDVQVELINGLLVEKMPKSPEHEWTTRKVHKTLESRVPPGWTAQEEAPVRIPAYDEPEPDVSVAQGSDDDYKHRHAGPADVALLVEVSDSSLPLDHGLKMLAYAKDRIPVYWIVNLVDRQVEVYSRPSRRGYRSRRDFKPGQQLPVEIGGRKLVPIPVDDILP